LERVEPKICRRLHSGIVDSLAMKQKAGRGVGFEAGAGGVGVRLLFFTSLL